MIIVLIGILRQESGHKKNDNANTLISEFNHIQCLYLDFITFSVGHSLEYGY